MRHASARPNRLGFCGAAGALFLLLLAGCADRPSTVPPSATVTPLTQMPSFAPVVGRVLPSVVNVSAVSAPVQPGKEAKPDAASTFDELLRHLFGLPPSQEPRQAISLGSGFVIDPSGYVVTADHVVADAADVTVILHDNTKLPARIVGRDSLTDLALLKVDRNQPLPAVAWGDSDAVQVGDWVVAVGNPFGLGGTVSSGILSARSRNLGSGPFDDFLQIDAAINRGNSGGPAFDLSGGVIGVVTAIYSPSGGSVGIAFATPSRLARPVIDQLRKAGRIQHGWLGVSTQEVTPDMARGLALPGADGVLIADVAATGPAAKAGLQPGDVVLSYGGRPLHSTREFAQMVAGTPPGRDITLTVWHQRHQATLQVTIDELAETSAAAAPERPAPSAPRPEPPNTGLGVTLAPLTPAARTLFDVPPELAGALVLAVAADSPLALLDIAPGDVLVSIDQQPVSTPRRAAAALRAAAERHSGTLLIQLNRSGIGHFIALPLGPTDSK